MPKRLQSHLQRTVKVRRKSMLTDDSTQMPSNLGEDAKGTHFDNSTKHMRYLKSNQNNEIERLLMNNSQSLLFLVDHSDFPAFNVGMWPQENCEMLTTYPSFNFSMPRPIFVADKQCEKIDVCFKRPMNRYYFMKSMRFTRTTYQTALKSNKNIRSSIKDDIYHYSIFGIAERVHMQPDPFFQSSYDYYFTGGNLCVLPHQGNVMHVGGEKLDEILASEFPVVNEYSCTDSLRTVASLKTSENSEIFELYPFMTSLSSSRQNCFVARQRNLVTFNCLNENNKMKTITQFRTKSTPFISFAQSDRETTNFIMTTMRQHIRLYDLSSGVPILVKLFEISPNETNISWNTVKPWRENTFMYANEKQFFMIDIRTSPEQWLKEVCLFNSSLKCDHISAIMPSDFNNLFYVATSHKLHCLDVRYIKKYSLNDSEGAVCRWTHQLRYAPLMMDTFRLRQTEYIALSSPIAGDLHICQLSRERNEDIISVEPLTRAHKHIYSSSCLAYQPPTLLEAYEHARLSGKCLRPEANMEARLKCCTTGMKFLNSPVNNSNCSLGLLLTSNSNGDVFAYTLSKREDKEAEERCNSQTDEIMKEFEQKICKQIDLPLNYTQLKNMKGLRKVFLCKPLSSVKRHCLEDMDNEYNEDAAEENNAANPEKKIRSRPHLGRWQKSLSNLHSYKDALVSDLLSIWDIDMEEEKNIRLGNLPHNVKTDPAIKVENWLQKNINPNPPMTTVPSAHISGYMENKTSNIFDSTFNINQTQNTIDFENAVHSTQILDKTSTNFNTSGVELLQTDNNMTAATTETAKNKKKNKKYVKGF